MSPRGAIYGDRIRCLTVTANCRAGTDQKLTFSAGCVSRLSAACSSHSYSRWPASKQGPLQNLSNTGLVRSRPRPLLLRYSCQHRSSEATKCCTEKAGLCVGLIRQLPVYLPYLHQEHGAPSNPKSTGKTCKSIQDIPAFRSKSARPRGQQLSDHSMVKKLASAEMV